MEYTHEELAKMYATNQTSIRRMAKELDISPDKIRWALKKYDIHRQQTHRNFPEYRKHQLNLHYFDNIDNEDKAYFLGYLYADGYVNDQCMRLNIHNQDYHILQKFCECLESDETIIKPFGDHYSCLTVNSIDFANSLHRQGVVQAKTKILKPPILDDNLIRHFIRGYFDGDGSIWFDKSSNSYRIQFIGTKPIVEYIADFFGIKTKLREATKDGLIYRYGFSGNQKISCAFNKIYEDSTVYLTRKHDKYLKCKELAEYKEQHRNEIWINNLGPYIRKDI